MSRRRVVLAVQDGPLPGGDPGDEGTGDLEDIIGERPVIESWGDVVDIVTGALSDLANSFIANLPLFIVGLLVFLLGVLVARYVARWTEHGLRRTPADRVVIHLTGRLVRFVIVVLFVITAFSIAGVNVGAALATLGLVGLALAFALQNILENFVAGVLLLVRKPFRAGDQIRTGEHEGTVEEIDLRVTRLLSYDGELVLVPNSDVFRNPLINLTRRAMRRTEVHVGVDYRDDHDRAREVLREAVTAVEGVMAQPEPQVLLHDLADSSVEFALLYWTAPDIRSVRNVRDRVLASAKSALEAEGMTIPWPIRTLAFDTPVEVRGGDGARSTSDVPGDANRSGPEGPG